VYPSTMAATFEMLCIRALYVLSPTGVDECRDFDEAAEEPLRSSRRIERPERDEKE
jgi:hypothetical protein